MEGNVKEEWAREEEVHRVRGRWMRGSVVAEEVRKKRLIREESVFFVGKKRGKREGRIGSVEGKRSVKRRRPGVAKG